MGRATCPEMNAVCDIYFELQTAMTSDLSSLLTSSKNLTSHLSRPDLPSVNLSLDQIEALSRRLISRQPGTSNDTDRAFVLYPSSLFPITLTSFVIIETIF